MERNWDEIRGEFCRLTAKRGVVKMAADIPADRATVYRLLKGETEHPTKAVQAAIEQIVEENKAND